MKILGVSGSPRDKKTSGVYKLVKTVLENTGHDYEIVVLKGKKKCISFTADRKLPLRTNKDQSWIFIVLPRTTHNKQQTIELFPAQFEL